MSNGTLRYATVSVSDISHPSIFTSLIRSESVSVESSQYARSAESGRYIGLSELHGDLDAARELLSASDQVLRYAVAGADEEGLLYATYRNLGQMGELIAIPHRYDLIFDWPIELRRSRGKIDAKVTVIGLSEDIRRAAADLPEGVSLSVEKVTQANSSESEGTARLTDRQRSLLEYAIREGYYEVPRQTTHREIAESLGLTTGTVSNRLQRIERRVMTAYADELS